MYLRKKYTKGFTLIELMVVSLIIGVLIVITISTYSGIAFEEFLKDYEKNICPEYDYITYVDGKVVCSLHTEEESKGHDDAPYSHWMMRTKPGFRFDKRSLVIWTLFF